MEQPTSDLLRKKCVPCEGGTPPLAQSEVAAYTQQLTLDWKVTGNKRIQHRFTFKNFRKAMVFVNAIAELAETEGHHPDIGIFYNKVDVTLWTHAVGGLSENDFILAAKIEQLAA